ncbi:FadR/GntR family transcriptional regulator [Actinocorallia aurantiaca]|uniref:FCD domain-containing protein n=1 Tax=Actinocorallia aurantiaca TaxID=46204 RepID=A0ABN3UQM8_9ACTN
MSRLAVEADSRLARVRDGGGPAPGGRAAGSVGKLASQVARRIEAEVIGRGWPVGEILDSEPVLRERYGVSQTVLREAARLLEHHQVARMRRGRGGGLVICAPDAGPAVRAVVVYIEYVGATPGDVLHARRLIEPLVGRLATERIDEGGIARLRATLAAELSSRRHGDWADGLFHAVLSEMTGNPVLQLFIDVLEQLTYRHAGVFGHIPRDELLRFTEVSHHRHAEIIDAAVAGDAPRAEVGLLEHLDEVVAWLGIGTDRERRGPVAPAAAPANLGTGTTLAETVAARIYQDVVDRGLRPGAVLGSEAELMDRYETSRAVLRAAVRLLEHHSVAASRRGPGGGLVVTPQAPQAAIDASALYLAFRGVTAEDLDLVREAIEAGTVARVAALRDEPDVARRLAELADRPPREPRDDDPAGDGGFHAELAGLAGNPVLSLFLRIITDLSRRIRAAHGGSVPPGACLDGFDRAHGEILGAIRDGDAGLAQHRMRRHLSS